ncbi:MAG: electron transport complex subunit E [Fluviicoccus sp.]|uniref:electron transport complex subunit E n=1 Tax=Fluviicoccus sp. TaxID=2003552 RepID=UPI0027180244|nr:electron transport complex subunit E [Fluviicoccus sp.]MDO8329461.1 electron transport complex subunit E [Fluviicoccus sp.]
MSHIGCQGCGSASAPETPGGGYRQNLTTGLWNNNVALVQMLGLCPTMAVTGTATNGLGMGVATMAVMMLSNLLISLLRNVISPEVRNPVMIAIIAGMVTVVDMAMNAWMHELYKVLGLFIALIVTNCAVLGRTEAFALRNGPVASVLDGLGMGLGFTWALTLLGGVREVLGSGTLFAGASTLLGPHFHWLEMTVMPADKGILLAILPPGGFMVLGIMLAGKRRVDQRLKDRRTAALRAEAALPVQIQL